MSRASFVIQTCTMHANLVEDRIRMDAVDENGAYQAIWLTRRLADQFIPHLAGHAEKQVEQGLPPALVLSADQLQLRSERAEKPIPPVTIQPAVSPWLCVTIHLNQQAEGLIWTLTDDRMIDAHMVLTGQGIRALLDIFLSNYRALGWPDGSFPVWIKQADAPAAVTPRSLN